MENEKIDIDNLENKVIYIKHKDEDKEFKYYCKKCEYGCYFLSIWKKHIKTQKHIDSENNIKKQITILKCPFCNYITRRSQVFYSHFLASHANMKQRKENYKYFCKPCNYGTFIEREVQRHIGTKKHKKLIEQNFLILE